MYVLINNFAIAKVRINYEILLMRGLGNRHNLANARLNGDFLCF